VAVAPVLITWLVKLVVQVAALVGGTMQTTQVQEQLAKAMLVVTDLASTA
jgi:hypothetical protein